MDSLPADLSCERLILGSVFTTERAMDTLRSTMEPSDFSLENHRRIWGRMCDLYDAGSPVDRVTVTHELIKRKELAPDGIGYLNSLEDGLPAIVNLESFITILKEKQALRQMLIAAQNIVLRCEAGAERADDIRESLCGMVVDLARSSSGDKKPISTHDLIKLHGPDKLLATKREAGIRLPWPRMNAALSGLHAAQMIVLAAYTGRGKTSAALQIATHATRQGITPLIWTMEMEPRRLFRRIVNQITEGRIDQAPTFEDRDRTRNAIAWVNDHPIYFDAHSRTVPSFCASIRQVQSQREVGLVIVDYLQLIRMAGRVESRTREVGENSRSLKLAAMDFGIPFLVLSQFKRPADGKSATIHDLKESGDIENDADVILLMNSGELSGDAEVPTNVYVGKQREGPAGFDVPLVFHPKSQTFYSPEDV